MLDFSDGTRTGIYILASAGDKGLFRKYGEAPNLSNM